MHDALSAPGQAAPDSDPLGEAPEVAAIARVESQPALGRAVGRGMAWLVFGNVATKVLSIVSFALLGHLLSPEDFGLWTMAFSFAAFTQFFRDGGVVQLLIQRGEKNFEALAGPVFWMTLAFNIVTAGVLAALAPFAGTPEVQPQLMKLLLIMAVAMPFVSPSSVMWARLQIDLRFAALSNIQVVSSILRYAVTIVAAWRHMGPMSFVIPILVITIFDNITYYLAVRDHPWVRPPKFRLWPELFRDSKWLVFVAFAYAVVNQGPFFLLSRIMDADSLGVFAYGYQIVGQLDQLLAATAAVALLPALARLNEEPERQAAATLRAARLMTLMSSLASMALVSLVAPVEAVVWGEKWAGAVWPAQVIGLAFTWRVLLWVPAPALQARGHFRLSAVMLVFAGLALMGAAWAGVKMRDGSPDDVALAMSVITVVAFFGLSLYGLSRAGVRPLAVAKGTIPTWLCCLGAALLALAAQRGIHHLSIIAALPPRHAAGVDILIGGVVFMLAAWGSLRLVMPSVLAEAANLIPARLAFLRRVLV